LKIIVAQFELSARHGYKRQGQFFVLQEQPSFLVSKGDSMSALYNRIGTVASASLSGAVDAAANLIAQLSELNELRERVRKAQLSTRRSRRTNHRKRART
jgi:hypothetical protein